MTVLFLTYLSVAFAVSDLNWTISNDILFPYAVRAQVYGITSTHTLYTMGGFGVDENPKTDIYRWNINNPGIWVKLSSQTPQNTFVGHETHSAIINDESIYIFAPYTAGNDPDGTVYLFSITNEQFVTHNIPSMPDAVRRPCVTKDDNNNIYLIGGYYETAGSPSSPSLQILDTTSNSWLSGINSIPNSYGTKEASCSYYNGYIYLFGGEYYDGSANQNSYAIYQYDIASNEWAHLTTQIMSNAAYNARAILGIDGCIYILGGFPMGSVQKFDPRTLQLVSVPNSSFFHPRYVVTAFSINDKIYAGAGYDGSSYFNSMEIASIPTPKPTYEPTTNPTIQPTTNPTDQPTAHPTTNPTIDPTTSEPTKNPTIEPTTKPTIQPTTNPTTQPTTNPTSDPITFNPTTSEPTTSDPTTSESMRVELIVIIISLGLLFIVLGGRALFYKMYLYPKQNRHIQQEQAEQQIDNNIPSQKQKQDESLNIGTEKQLPPTPQLNVEKSLPSSSQFNVISLPMKTMENMDDMTFNVLYGNRMETNGRNDVQCVGMMKK